MQAHLLLGLPWACALGACVAHTAGGTPAPSVPLPRLAAAAEEPPGIVALPSPCGLAVVGNEGELHFRMELAGERVAIRHAQPGDSFRVDGLMVQVSTAVADEIAPTARDQSGIALLRMHATWEAARRSQPLGRDVEPEEVAILSAENAPAGLAWWFPSAGAESGAGKEAEGSYDGYSAAAPAAAPGPRPTGVAFMTAAYGKRVLVVSVAGQQGESKSALVAKAQAFMTTVVTSPEPIATSQVRAGIQAATAAGQTCPGRPNAVLEP
jgi:hypothetical protein